MSAANASPRNWTWPALVGLVLCNFIVATFGLTEWTQALDRSLFQAFAVLWIAFLNRRAQP